MSEDPEAQRKRALIDTEMDPDLGNPEQDQEESHEPSLRTPLPRPGAILGQYQIVEVLGAGGVGEVFRAHDTQLQRDVALKVLRASSLLSATTQKRFVQEARAAGRLRHPGIVAVHEIWSSVVRSLRFLKRVRSGWIGFWTSAMSFLWLCSTLMRKGSCIGISSREMF